MRINDYEQCQHRLPGMPVIHCDPLCGLTAADTVCSSPTYETCPRYEKAERLCPICDGQWVKDTADWVFVCTKCGREFSVVDGIMGVVSEARAG